MVNHLIEPLQLHEPAPCDSCGLRERCAREHLACDSFAVYLNGKGGAKRWQSALRAPTRARYMALRLDLDEAA